MGERYLDYLNEVIIPWFKPLIYQDVMSSLFDTNGVILYSTEKSAKSVGYKMWQEAIGTSYQHVNLDLVIKMLGDGVKESASKIVEACHKIYRIHQLVVSSKNVINFIDLMPYNNQYKSYLETYIPIFHPDGTVVAVQSVTVDFKVFEFSDLFFMRDDSITGKSLSIPNDLPPIELPTRQHEILYLILHGIPQEYAAQILNIKRGTLARIISDQICPKFGIHGSNTKLLIEKAMQMGFNEYMPKSLWFPGIIILDDNIAQQINQPNNE